MKILYNISGLVILVVLLGWAMGWDNFKNGNHNLGDAYEASTEVMANESKNKVRCTDMVQPVTLNHQNPSISLLKCQGRNWSISRSTGGIIKGRANGSTPYVFADQGPISFSGQGYIGPVDKIDLYWTSGPEVEVYISYPMKP